MPRLLIANRGEIAVRVARTAREMGWEVVVVYSEADAQALHVAAADHAFLLGPAEPARSYLDVARLLEAARATGAAAIHPGYGFLSENASFAQAVLDAGLVWVGPPPSAMAALGDKLAGREAAIRAGVPVLPGARDPAAASTLGYPLLVKASGGGGGRGMRVVADPAALDEALVSAAAEAGAAFGNPEVYLERYVARPRHVEVQVMGDRHGRVVAWGERECSIQRRHQKLVEEAPCAVLAPERRQALHEAAVRLASAANYQGAGTVEFLLDGQDFYFLELNARLQVEHPVSELVYGVDLVREQLRVAMGEAATLPGPPQGHAIECRLIAEDPAAGFVPSPGTIGRVVWPEGPGVRVDAGVAAGSAVSPHYDALLAKLVVHGPTREAARARALRALQSLVLTGVAHTGEFLAAVLASPAFAAAELHTGFVAEVMGDWSPPEVDPALYLAAWSQRGARPAAAGPAAIPDPWRSLGRWGRA